MNVTLKAKNIAFSDSMKAYIEEKIVASLEKTLGSTHTEGALLDIEVGKISRHHRKGLVWEALATLRIGHEVLRSEARGESFQEGVDLLEGEILHELKKFKGKQSAVGRRGARRAKKNATIAKAAHFPRVSRIREEGL